MLLFIKDLRDHCHAASLCAILREISSSRCFTSLIHQSIPPSCAFFHIHATISVLIVVALIIATVVSVFSLVPVYIVSALKSVNPLKGRDVSWLHLAIQGLTYIFNF